MAKRLFGVLFAMLVSAVGLRAQTVDFTVSCESEGMYQIRWKDIEPYMNPATLDVERLVILHNGVHQPLYLTGIVNGAFGRTSKIIFYNAPRRDDVSRTHAYRLTYEEHPPRIREAESKGERDLVTLMNVRADFSEELLFDAWETVNAKWLGDDAKDRPTWFWRRIAPANGGGDGAASAPNSQTFALKLSPRPRTIDTTPTFLNIRLRSNLADGTAQSMKVVVTGREVFSDTWTEAGMRTVRVPFPGALLQDTLVVAIENTSAAAKWPDTGNQVKPQQANDILVDSMTLEYPALLLGPTNEQGQIVYRFRTDPATGTRTYRFAEMNGEGFHLYDIAKKERCALGHATAAAGVESHFVAVTPDGYYAPKSVRPTSKRRLDRETEGADWVAVALERFAPILRPLAEQRQKQGLKTMVVTDQDVYDGFSGGEFTPQAIRRFMEHATKNWKTKPKYLLLVGDADRGVDWVSQKSTLPTIETPTYYNGASASDEAFVDGLAPAVAVGRLPARAEVDVVRMITKILHYENDPPEGEWRKRLSFIASEGRFSRIIDALIEKSVTDMLEQSVPAGFDVNMTYANLSSPYLYPPAKFNDEVKRRFNDGALFFAYIGHGYKSGFDALRVGKSFYPILSEKDVPDLDAGDRSPIMGIIACSTAHFDDPSDDSIGEELLRSGKGPVAVFGATRISHPFANAVLGRDMLEGFFRGERTIGEILSEAKTKMAKEWKASAIAALGAMFVTGLDVDRLVKDHQHLYCLLGDPATRPAMPSQKIALSVPEQAAPGQEITVAGTIDLPADTKITLTLECERHAIIHPVTEVNAADPATEPKVLENYAAANDKVAARTEAQSSAKKFEAKLILPIDLPSGTYYVKAYANAGKLCAVGAAPLRLAKP